MGQPKGLLKNEHEGYESPDEHISPTSQPLLPQTVYQPPEQSIFRPTPRKPSKLFEPFSPGAPDNGDLWPSLFKLPESRQNSQTVTRADRDLSPSQIESTKQRRISLSALDAYPGRLEELQAKWPNLFGRRVNIPPPEFPPGMGPNISPSLSDGGDSNVSPQSQSPRTPSGPLRYPSETPPKQTGASPSTPGTNDNSDQSDTDSVFSKDSKLPSGTPPKKTHDWEHESAHINNSPGDADQHPGDVQIPPLFPQKHNSISSVIEEENGTDGRSEEEGSDLYGSPRQPSASNEEVPSIDPVGTNGREDLSRGIRDRSTMDLLSSPSTIRNRRRKGATSKYFLNGPPSSRNAEDLEIRRFSQPGVRHLAWGSISGDDIPLSAPPALESYGPFEIIFSKKDSDSATFDERMRKRRERLEEDLKRARNTSYVRLSSGVIIPTQLLAIIAKRRDGRQISLSDFATSNSLSYDVLEDVLQYLDAEQIPGSSFIPEPTNAQNSSGIPNSNNNGGNESPDAGSSDEEENIIRKAIAWVLDIIRLHWDVIPNEDFYKVRWSLGGNFAIPKLEFFRDKVNNKLAELHDIGSNLLKWALELLAFLFGAAGRCAMIPVTEARRLVRSIRETLRDIRVTTDHIGREAYHIISNATIAATNTATNTARTTRESGMRIGRRAGEWTGRQVGRVVALGERSLQVIRAYWYLVSLFCILPLLLSVTQYYQKYLLEFLRFIFSSTITIPDLPEFSLPNLPDMPHLPDVPHLPLSHWTTQIQSVLLLALYILRNYPTYIWSLLKLCGWVPVLCTGLLVILFTLVKRLSYEDITNSLVSVIDLQRRLISWTGGVGIQVARGLDLPSRFRSIRASLPWLLPFTAFVVSLWRWGSLEAAYDFATATAGFFLDIMERGLEGIAQLIQNIPVVWIRDILLNVWLSILQTFYQWKDAVAPYIGLTSVVTAIVLLAMVADDIFGSGHFWSFVTELFHGIQNCLMGLPNLFRWSMFMLSIISRSFWSGFLRSFSRNNAALVGLLREVWDMVKRVFGFFGELVADTRALFAHEYNKMRNWFRARSTGEQTPIVVQERARPSNGAWPANVRWFLEVVLRWIFQTFSVAAGVWLALFVCGMCLSCSGGSCFRRSNDTPEGIQGLVWNMKDAMLMVLRQQQEAITQIGMVLARFVKQSELETNARDHREELLTQAIQQITQMLEERRTGWSVRRIFGSAS